MTTRGRILSLLQELQIEPKKSLGQNFLISDHVIQKILSKVTDMKPQSWIEVGPGLGALTEGLLRLPLPFQMIELDSVFSEYWRKRGLQVIEQDALKWDWSQLQLPRPRVLVSNLPYQISSSLVVERTLDQAVEMMVLMFQKEVAQRLKAQAHSVNYGMLSVFAQTFWDIQFLLEASSGDFMPPPKVASRVLVFIKKTSLIKDNQQFLKFIKSCFLHPRKLMISNICEGLGANKEFYLRLFTDLGIKEKTRAQELSVKEFNQLYKAMGYH